MMGRMFGFGVDYGRTQILPSGTRLRVRTGVAVKDGRGRLGWIQHDVVFETTGEAGFLPNPDGSWNVTDQAPVKSLQAVTFVIADSPRVEIMTLEERSKFTLPLGTKVSLESPPAVSDGGNGAPPASNGAGEDSGGMVLVAVGVVAILAVALLASD